MKKYTKADFNLIAEYIREEYTRRKQGRHLDKQWAEVDRQLRMEPDKSRKMTNGKVDPKNDWLPEVELPLQSQTLEILNADARRMMFPDSGPWFQAHIALTDKYLEGVDFQSMITGDENDVPSQITQDNADKLVEGVLNHWHRQYDFYGAYDAINSEAFKYGTGVGKGRLVTKNVFINTAKGVVSDKQKIPVLFPRSIKNTYLDDNPYSLMNEGHILGSSVIEFKSQRIQDLKMAAKKGSTDPKSMEGGWMPRNLNGLEGDDRGVIDLLEYEGDLVVPKNKDSIVITGAIITIVCGKHQKKDDQRVVRLRFREFPFQSHIIHPYHLEDLNSPYGTSPLMKGMPIQKAAVDALSTLLVAGALSVEPPIGYDNDDLEFAASGGPRVYPGAQWPTTGDIVVHDNIGDPSAMFAIYSGFLAQYADVTGVNAPRLGGQTVSHTTAYAKEAEISRGTIRTVDYVRSVLKGPAAQWLNMAYQMGRKVITKDTIYIDAYNGFVDITKKALPEIATFDVHGAGGPGEEQDKMNARIQSLQMAISLDQVKAQYAQLGIPPTVNIEAAIEQVLREGKWNDVDAILGTNAPIEGTEPGPALGNAPQGVATAPGAAIQALQNR